MDLSDPVTFGRISSSTGAASTRPPIVCRELAAAQDMVQDPSLRVSRNPQKSTSRGEVGSYLRLMAGGRSVDL